MARFHELKRAFSRCSSIFFTMNRLVSRNRSTHDDRQDSSLRENEVDGVPVMHLGRTLAKG